MANQWKQKGIPHKGWILNDVVDVLEDQSESWELAYESCMMCGNERIRYVHLVSHPDVEEEFRVGCVCAERMTEDYVNPKILEQKLSKRTRRRVNWLNKTWKRNINGNYFLKLEGRFLLIYRDKQSRHYKIRIKTTFGKKSFTNLIDAKMAVFKGVEYYKEKGTW